MNDLKFSDRFEETLANNSSLILVPPVGTIVIELVMLKVMAALMLAVETIGHMVGGVVPTDKLLLVVGVAHEPVGGRGSAPILLVMLRGLQ